MKMFRKKKTFFSFWTTYRQQLYRFFDVFNSKVCVFFFFLPYIRITIHRSSSLRIVLSNAMGLYYLVAFKFFLIIAIRYKITVRAQNSLKRHSQRPHVFLCVLLTALLSNSYSNECKTLKKKKKIVFIKVIIIHLNATQQSAVCTYTVGQ